jgi:tRNA(Ile)-lysidine synthase
LVRSLDLKVTTKKIDVRKFAKLHKLSLEDAARRVRYDFLEKTAQTVGADKIAVGHNSDDQVETFLMRLIRGSGAKGLRGIQPKRGRIIRPLIDCARDEIEKYCRWHKLRYRVDHTNFQTKYLRNKIRHHLLPILSKYNPNIRQNLKNTAELLGEDFNFINDLADKTLAKLRLKIDRKEITLDRGEFNKLPYSLRLYVLRNAIERVKGDLVDISVQNIKDVVGQSDGQFTIDLPVKLWVLGGNKEIIITQNKPHKPQRIVFEHKLRVPGRTEIPEIGSVINAEVKTLARRSPKGVGGLKRKKVKKDSKIAFLDADKLKGGLKVRNWRPGDKFRPFGMQGTKKLQDFFVDNKIPLKERYRVPVLESNGQIVWVGAQRIDDRFKVVKDTRQILVLTLF